MAKVVQVELRTPNAEPGSYTHMVVWVDAGLKPTRGMSLVCKNDARPWEVVQAYKQTLEQESINSTWRVGGLS